MNIPALVQVKVPKDVNGKMAIVDGKAGAVLVDPDEDTLAKYKKLQAEEIEKRKLLDAMKGLESVTKSGKHVHLYCNIGGVGDIGYVLENDGEGVGLFRSEFLYLQNDDYPTEEQQFQAYKQVAEILAGKQLIIRTLDIGADKQIDYFNLEKEENPALGFRAIRICLTREEIFMTQLKALLRASAYGNVAIMFPMIISKWEVERSLKLLEAAKADLRAHDVPFNENISVGIMIETPAAVFMADELAELVDFFLIGTNDLTQYTCAIDRQNQKLEKFFDAHHPAVLKAIQMTIDAGHRHNTWVGICGELGADPELTEVFVKMGIDELSMSPTSILRTRKIIRDMD
jgi:phosphotransferase system enzyme I (PtsI)